MPIYEYVCERCGKTSEFLETAGKAIRRRCEGCGSPKLRKAFSSFAARSKTSSSPASSRKSSGCASCSSRSCSTCRH